MKIARPVIIDGGFAYITLTRGQHAIIDLCDLPLVDGYNWYAVKKSNTFYAARTHRANGCKKIIHMHRVICGDDVSDSIDHINGNGLDNTRKNLRPCSNKENCRNQGLRSNNKSGIKGVGWQKREKKWRARIDVDGKCISLGYYSDIADAEKAYEQAAIKYFGDFARTASVLR